MTLLTPPWVVAGVGGGVGGGVVRGVQEWSRVWFTLPVQGYQAGAQ